MGVADLMSVIKKNASMSIYSIEYSSFRNKKIAIDTSIWSYRKFRELLPGYVVENDEENLSGAEDENPSGAEDENPSGEEFWVVKWGSLKKRWLGSMLEIASLLLKENITPIFIMEDTSSPIKLDESERREKEKRRLEESYLKAREEFNTLTGRFDRNDKMEKFKSSFVNQVRFDTSFNEEFYQILRSLQVPVYYCIEESDFLIASLAREGIIDATLSTDTDLIVYGVPFVITKFYGGQFTVVNLNEFLQTIDFTKEQLIDLAILLGTDYNTRVKGVGPITGFDLISFYEKIELLPSKFYQASSRRSLVRSRFLNVPEYRGLIKGDDPINFDIDCQEIIEMGSERLSKFRLSTKWENLTT